MSFSVNIQTPFHTHSQVLACVVEEVRKKFRRSATSVQLAFFMHSIFFVPKFIDLKLNQTEFRVLTNIKYTMNATGNGRS